MDDPKQYVRDPATGNLVEGRWVCPSCKFVNGAVPRCCYPPCGWLRPVIVGEDDDEEPEEPTWPLESDPPTIIDPPKEEK